MKTTIDIPEPLYKKAKIRAVELGQTLKQVVIASLEKDLQPTRSAKSPNILRWSQRKLRPEFARLQAAGAFKAQSGHRDITDLISEDRDERPL